MTKSVKEACVFFLLGSPPPSSKTTDKADRSRYRRPSTGSFSVPCPKERIGQVRKTHSAGWQARNLIPKHACRQISQANINLFIMKYLTNEDPKEFLENSMDFSIGENRREAGQWRYLAARRRPRAFQAGSPFGVGVAMIARPLVRSAVNRRNSARACSSTAATISPPVAV